MRERRRFWRVGVERFDSQNRKKLASSDGFLKFESAKNLHPTVAQERFESQNRKKLASSDDFLSLDPQNLHHAVARERFGGQNR